MDTRNDKCWDRMTCLGFKQGFNLYFGTLWIILSSLISSSSLQSTMQHQEKHTLHWHSYSDHLREALNEMMIQYMISWGMCG